MNKKEFTIDDIRTGDIVVTKNKGNAIVIGRQLKKTNMLFNTESLSCLTSYNKNLKHKYNSCQEYNIEKVYKIIDSHNYSLDKIIDELPVDKVELIWERKREIDWTKVPKFTKVQVKDRGTTKWENRYYIGYNKENIYSYKATCCDPFTYQDDTNEEGWEEIKFYDESDVKEEWYK